MMRPKLNVPVSWLLPLLLVASAPACGSSSGAEFGDSDSGSKRGNGSSGASGNPSGDSGSTPGPQYPGAGKGFKPLVPGCGPSTALECTGSCEERGGDGGVVIRPPATLCFAGEGDPTPDDPSAVIEQVVEKVNGQAYVHIRITFDPAFTDNTYGEGTSSGWPVKGGPKGDKPGDPKGDKPGMPDMKAQDPKPGHTFGDLTGSDHTELLLTDGEGNTVMSFKVDLISQDESRPCGYGSLGVRGGDGKMLLGDPDHVLAVSTSIDRNLNGCGYCESPACGSSGDCTVDSPSTDDLFTPNPETPNWDYRQVYEVWIALDAFGDAGFGQAYITYTHSSPAKAGNTIEVEPTPCPPEWDRPYCPPGVIEEGGNCYGGDGECPPNQQTYITSEGASLCTPIPFANYDDMKPCPDGYELDRASEGQYCLPVP